MNTKHPKADTIQKIGELRASRFTFKEIGRLIGLSTSRVHAICKQFGYVKEIPQSDVAQGDVSFCNVPGTLPPQES